MKFVFGEHDSSHIEAKNIEVAIKLFKISELYPEKYVDEEYIESKEYISGQGYTYEFTPNPMISVMDEESNVLRKIPLHECINVDYKSLLPVASNLLEAPQKEKEQEEKGTDVLVIGNPTDLPKHDKVALRAMNDQLLLRKKEMEMMMSQIHTSMSLIQEELTKKRKLLFILETYLGLNEEVLQIQEGQPAPEEENLSLYQQVLFMDEEVGVWEDDGIDFTNIEVFDEFILRNYEKFLYKPKSICAFHVRRFNKEYTDNPFANSFMNQPNHKTYFLVRNGENLYRIWSDVGIDNKLFPSQDEYEKAMKEGFGSESSRMRDVQQKHERYFYGVIAIQGLIERTDILGTSLRESVNLVKNSGIERITFIRDAEQEFWLVSGRLSWNDFYKKNRETITQGTRVVITDWIRPNDKESGNRFYPFRPDRGPSRDEIYEVMEHRTDEDRKRYHSWEFKIMFNPGDTVYRYWDSSPRKKRVPCWLYSSEVLNFDSITIEECEYYEKNRFERRQYLKILPILHFIKKIKMEEQALEKEFVKYVAGLLGWGEDSYQKIQDTIVWWKLKNKWKRGLMKDDAKAVRMIVKKLKSKSSLTSVA